MAAKQVIFRLTVLLIITTGFIGCANLRYVSEFSSASVKSIEQFGKLDYSFSQNCLDVCQMKTVRDLKIEPYQCDCSLDEKADSVTSLIYNVAKDYLEGLAKLSGKGLTTYNNDALTKALSKGSFGPVKIEDDQADAYSRLTKLLVTAFTEEYRSRTIKKYVTEANEPFCVLLNALDFNLSENLSGKLKIREERIKNIYSPYVQSSKLSEYEKKKALEEYYAEFARLESLRKNLETYSRALKRIESGHRKLAENIDDWNKDEVIRQIRMYSADIRSIISDFR